MNTGRNVDAALIAPIATESPRIIRSLWTSSEWLGVGRSDGIGIDGSAGMGRVGMGSVGIGRVDRSRDFRRRRPGLVGGIAGRQSPTMGMRPTNRLGIATILVPCAAPRAALASPAEV